MAILDELLDDIVDVEDERDQRGDRAAARAGEARRRGRGRGRVAALLAGQVGGSGRVCALLSGGNIDPTLLISVMRHGLTLSGRYLVVRSRVADLPGELIKLLRLVADERGNVVSVEHHREGDAIHVAETEVELTVVTRDDAHRRAICEAMEARGFPVEQIQ